MDVSKLFFDCGAAYGLVIVFCYVLFRGPRESRNPMDWTLVDRCLLLILIYFFMVGSFSLCFGIMKLMPPDRFPYLKWNIMQPFYQVYRLFATFQLTLLIIGLFLRRRNVESPLFVHFTIQLNAIFLAYTCYGLGPVTHPGPLLLAMTFGTFYLLLFDLKYSLPWVITFTFLFVCSTIAVWIGLIPYSPGSGPPFIDGKIDEFYFVGTAIFALMIFLLMLFIITIIIIRWRDRENSLADMTRLLKKMFGRYLSTEVMNSLIENPSALELGGERRKVTIMMTDLRGFTALSERLEPEKVVEMLNIYFEVMVDVILKYNGTINEIIGDALLVVFGAPQEMPERTQEAIACAIEMQNAMENVNEQNRSQGLPELEMGIGLNETEAIVGNIGSSKRSKYSVVGSGVNMTSRIESYTVGGQILISESVRKAAGAILRVDRQEEVLPKGAETPLRIYEVGGISGHYNLALEGKNPRPVTLAKRMPILYGVLEGKMVGKNDLEGSVVQLSDKSAVIDLNEPLRPLINLKMKLEDVDEKLKAHDFYGKVVSSSGENGLTHIVRFTSVPPEVDAYFHAFRQHATKLAVI